MYLEHFGLTEPPFSITPDPRYVYLSDRHREALAHLLYGVAQGGGFVQLTGEVGTGKTTLSRCLLEQLPANVELALILNPRLTAAELVAAVCDELHVPYPSNATSLKLLIDALNARLLETHAAGRRTILVIDEAQDLGRDVLEQVRLLTNLETTRDKLLQIILIGQPELQRALARRDMRQLAQRVTARYHLLPLARHETIAYVRHRLKVSGAKGEVFTPMALRTVHSLSGGVPRLINVICDRALLGAYARDRLRIDARTVRRAAAEALARPSAPVVKRWLWTGAAATALVAVSLAAPYWLSGKPVTPVETTEDTAPKVPTSIRQQSPAPAQETPEPVADDTPDIDQPSAPNPPDLADWLPDPADQSAAFTAMFNAWGLDYDDLPGISPCHDVSKHGLQCSVLQGDWGKLRSLDRPAVVELVLGDGSRRYAAVTAIDRDRVTLRHAQHEIEVPRESVDTLPLERFTVLWRPPTFWPRLIGPGSRGDAVRWLRDELAEVDGQTIASADTDVYDASLRERVMTFQRESGLAVDGIVGEQTLLRLTAATHQPGTPTLSRNP